MRKIIDTGLIYLFCCAMILFVGITLRSVAVVLLLFIVVCGENYCKDKKISTAIGLLFVGLTVVLPEGIYGLPVAVYGLCQQIWQAWETKSRREIGFAAAAGVALCILVFARTADKSPDFRTAVCLLVTAAAAFLQFSSYQYSRLKEEYIRTKDNDREYSRALKMKNQYLIEKQNIQIYNATLKERNRIAREIHDNVGHLLSRCLIQTGAVIAVNQDDNIAPLLNGMKETLNSAMNSIRSSVHDLHDESVDLDQTIQEMLSKMEQYTVHYEYDFSAELSRDLKYCVISIVKEALSNIVKHSNADTVEVVLREHPAFYQILIQDNGSSIHQGDGTGIGLENIKERVQDFSGTVAIDSRQGFRIFIHIPKANDVKAEE